MAQADPWPLPFQIDDSPVFCQTVDDQTVSASGALNASFTSQWDDFLWLGSVAQSTGSFSTRINAQYDGGYLDNDKVRSDCFWGTAQYPFWHAPKFVPQGAQITFEITDRSAAQNKVRLGLLGIKARPGDKEKWGRGRGLFLLATPSAGLAITGNLTLYSSIVTETSYDLRVGAITAAQTSSSWLGKYSYKDPRISNKIPSSQNRMHSTFWTGSNTLPFRPRGMPRVQAGSSLELDLQDESGSTNTVYIVYVCDRLPPGARC